MKTSEPCQPLVDEIEYLLAEQRLLSSQGPAFFVQHSYHVPGTLCLPGESVEQVYLWHNFIAYPLRLGHASLLLFDCLGRYRQTLLTAAKIEEIMLNDPFYTNQGVNSVQSTGRVVVPRRATVKVFIGRIRERLDEVFHEAELGINPSRVLVSEGIDSNVVAYRLKAHITFLHQDRSRSGDLEPLHPCRPH